MQRLFLHLKKPVPVQAFVALVSQEAGSSDPFSQSAWPSHTQALGMHETRLAPPMREKGDDEDFLFSKIVLKTF